MPHDPYKALYIHLPFCVRRCGYCDFATSAVAREDPTIDSYVETLVMDVRRLSRDGELTEVETVYLGGGTPSHIGIKRLSSLLYALSVSMDLTREGLEFTMEANPESLDGHMVRDIWALGVNRISIGVQSFDDEVLRILGRPHDAKRARAAIAEARERFENVSIDLMCGIPGQSLDSFEASVHEAVGLGVKHVSVYPLAIEPHTPFYRAVMEGRMDEPDEDVQADHMRRAAEFLQEAGMNRYEVASYAYPGFESKHNSVYWSGVPYLGLGQAATTMTQNDERRMRKMDDAIVDDLDRRQMEAEDLMLGMRRACGVSDEKAAMAARYVDGVAEALAELEEAGYIIHDQGRWKPTEQGWLCGNDLYGRLLDLAP